MGRKKPFIDKSKATTYHVMYKEHDDAEDPFEFVSADDMRQRAAEAAEAASARHPLAFLYENEEDQVQSEEQRQEIIGMGLPDDGYNYLKHMRTPGSRQQLLIVPSTVPEEQTAASEEQQQGAKRDISAFVPPAEDIMFYDASSLPVSGTGDKQDTVDGRQITVSAFSRPIYHADKVSKLASIAEVTGIMEALDEDDAVFLETEGFAPEAVLGDGDLLDDFVESAQQADVVDSAEEDAGPSAARDGMLERLWEWDNCNDTSEGSEAGAPQLVRRSPASIADSFWRKDREDRTYAQTVVDERLIARMDVEYGDDDIGSLEDEEEATRSHRSWGNGDMRLQKVLGAYERTHQNGRAVANCALSEKLAQLRTCAPAATSSGGQHDMQDDEAIARAKALEAAQRYESCAPGRDNEAHDTTTDASIACMLAPRPVAEDCESVISCCSNLYNHPGKISEGHRSRKTASNGSSAVVSNAGLIQLSSKTGLPIGVHGEAAGKLSEVDEEGSASGADDDDCSGPVNLGEARGKAESTGDKKARKAAVKEAQRMARQRKKESKQLFASANASMQHHVASNSRAQRTVVHIV